MSTWLLEVTDLKQYTYCPRIVFYRYCLPRVRPITYSMEEGIRCHEELVVCSKTAFQPSLSATGSQRRLLIFTTGLFGLHLLCSGFQMASY